VHFIYFTKTKTSASICLPTSLFPSAVTALSVFKISHYKLVVLNYL
jgi:hypothetical protein